jgi:hypothetical protein
VNVARFLSLSVVAVLCVYARAAAVTGVMTEADVAEAMSIANGSEPTRAVFHAAYLVGTDDPLIERLEVITEFRRFVLAAEDQLKAGNWMMARGGFDTKGRTLKDILRPFTGQVSLRAELRFHPQNYYAALPPFDMLLAQPTLLAINATRAPHVTPASGEPGSRDVINGATIEVFYNAATINNRSLPIRLILENRETARVTVDFSRLR